MSQTTSVMIRKDTLLRTRLSAFFQNTDLFRDVAESVNDFFVAVVERENGIWNPRIATELENKLLGTTQVVAWDTWVKMVDGLELQTTVEEIQPCRTVHIHGRTKHLLGEGFMDAQISSGHGEVRKSNLDMQWSSDHVGNQGEKDPTAPVRNGAVKNTVTEPCPEKDLACNFEPAVPPGRSLSGSLVAKEVSKA